MRKIISGAVLALVVAASASAQDRPAVKPDPVSEKDTVKVVVVPMPGSNQFRLDFHVVNSDSIAGMPIPVRITAEDATVNYDSVSYEGGRVEYFQLKTQNADTANQTLLLGLIADLSGTKPPLAPGRGKALSVYCTSTKPVAPKAIKVEHTLLPPANKLEFNSFSDGAVRSLIPVFLSQVGKPDTPEQKGSMGKGKGQDKDK